MGSDAVGTEPVRSDPQPLEHWIKPAWHGPIVHASCYEWVGQVVREHDLASHSTIEIGAGIVNGTIRDHFNGAYIGVDIGLGNGVDRVENSEQLSDGNATWATVISTEMLEHCSRPWRAVNEMSRICENGGHVIITARGYDERGCWEVHAYPNDMYRYSDQSMRVLAEDAGLHVLEVTRDSEGPGWFLHAVKP